MQRLLNMQKLISGIHHINRTQKTHIHTIILLHLKNPTLFYVETQVKVGLDEFPQHVKKNVTSYLILKK